MNLFNFDLNNIIKLFKKGDIPKVYEKMYFVAEKLAWRDFHGYKTELFFNKTIRYMDYVDERREYHMNEMKKLLRESMKYKENKND
jgi:hypothetical protein